MKNSYYVTTMQKENRPGKWNSLKVTVYMKGQDGGDDIYCGEYERSYSSLMNTFVPFMKDEKEYALFSDEYWKTSIMTLPDCGKIATEETVYYMRDYKNYNPNENDVLITKEQYEGLCMEDDANGVEYKYRRGHAYEGFCPVDFYVPETVIVKHKPFLRDELGNDIKDVNGKLVRSDIEEDYVVLNNDDARFAFVAGCIWGDDTSWKIEKLDLSQIERGIVGRSQAFGYIELPACLKLKDAITIDQDDDYVIYYITINKTYSEENGRVIER